MARMWYYPEMAETGPRPFVNRNVSLQDIPADVDKVFNWLATLTGKSKLVLYKEALIEYAENHRSDILKLAAEMAASEGSDDG